MKKCAIFIITILLLVWANGLLAQENSRVGTSAAQFLKIGVGARAAALGECGTAIPGVTGLYWNPAAVAAVDKVSLYFSNISMYAGLTHSFFGAAYPMGAGNTVGVSVIYLGSDDIEITTVDDPDGLGTYYSLNDYAISVTYSRYVTDRLALGFSAKYIHEGFYRNKATALAVDIGSMLDTGLLGMKLAMSLSNFGGNMKMGGASLRVDHERFPNVTSSPGKDADLY